MQWQKFSPGIHFPYVCHTLSTIIITEYCHIKPLTNWVSIEESNWSPENRGKHLVVENTRGIHTDEVEHDSSGETQENGRQRAGRVDGNPLMCGEEAGGGY